MRLRVLDEAGGKCQQCGDKTKTLHVNHRYYVAHRLPWEYPLFCFEVLCEAHHFELKSNMEISRKLGGLPLEDWEVLLEKFYQPKATA